MLNNYIDYFKGILWVKDTPQIPKSLEKDFLESNELINIVRIRYVALLVVIFAGIHIFSSLPFKSLKGDKLTYFYLDFAIELVSLLFLAIFYKTRNLKVEKLKGYHILFNHMYIVFLLIWNASITAMDLQNMYNVSNYIVAIFFLVAFTYIQNFKLLIYFLISFASMAVVTYARDVSLFKTDAILPIIILIVLALLTSRILFNYRREHFLNQKNEEKIKKELYNEIEEKKKAEDELRKAKDVLDEEVVNRTIELTQTNQNLLKEIAKRKKTELELIDAKEKAEEADNLKSSFIANMSHEVRTPLNAILGFTELITRTELDAQKKEHYFEIINSSSNRLMTLINDIIDISRIETGQIEIVKEHFAIQPVLESIYKTFKTELIKSEKNDIELEILIPENIKGSLIYSDYSRFNQIFHNLLSNAVKFTDKGKIKFGYSRTNFAEFQFFVSDTGIGISQENQEFVFENFRQVSLGKNRLYEGTGLGLSICKNLVELMDGKIWIDSILNKGTTVFFTQRSGQIVENQEQQQNPGLLNGQKLNWKNKKVLIVEDIPENLFYLSEILSDYGINCLQAESGEEAILKVRENRDIDMVFMDIQLPDMNGIEATERIKEINKKIKVIAQTAYALSGDKQKILKAGCDDYLAKPISNEVLQNTLISYL